MALFPMVLNKGAGALGNAVKCVYYVSASSRTQTIDFASLGLPKGHYIFVNAGGTPTVGTTYQGDANIGMANTLHHMFYYDGSSITPYYYYGNTNGMQYVSFTSNIYTYSIAGALPKAYALFQIV